MFYFVRHYDPRRHGDADNVSKPTWDALEGLAYDDDHRVRLRIAAVIEMEPEEDGYPSIQGLDLSAVPVAIADRLLEFVESDEDHVVYVELGAVTSEMLTFGIGCETERHED